MATDHVCAVEWIVAITTRMTTTNTFVIAFSTAQ